MTYKVLGIKVYKYSFILVILGPELSNRMNVILIDHVLVISLGSSSNQILLYTYEIVPKDSNHTSKLLDSSHKH